MDRKIMWLPVNAEEGMFTSEYAVNFKASNGETLSLFVDKSLLKKEATKFFLKTTLINEISTSVKRILLPSETFETASPWAEVLCG